jgi:hypothetical protein
VSRNKGERYRASTISATGWLTLEKKLSKVTAVSGALGAFGIVGIFGTFEQSDEWEG